jgi:hypothetical protein
MWSALTLENAVTIARIASQNEGLGNLRPQCRHVRAKLVEAARARVDKD